MDQINNIYPISNSLNVNSNLSFEFQSKYDNFYRQRPIRTIFDPVHGHIELESYIWNFIDKRQFQRLRHLKQLANCSQVYLGATHTRFEHSIGVGYLANDLFKHLFRGDRADFEFYSRAVTLAGLCHDLGHGPFSHTFDRFVLKSLDPSITWEHEEGSKMLFEHLIDENSIDIEEDQKKLIQSLILGEEKLHTEYPWIYQIVANKKNSIDVDKFDYICRDTYHIGLQSASVDYTRIFCSSLVIDNNICFHVKNDYNILSLFQSRFRLHKQVYRHKKSIPIEMMIKDALILSNNYFDFLSCIHNPNDYMKLTDSITNTIRNFPYNDDEDVAGDPNLMKAARLIERLYSRDVYKFVGQIVTPGRFTRVPEVTDMLTFCNPKDDSHLTIEDIEFFHFSIDFGNGDRNPFDSINFYKSEDIKSSFHISKKFSLSLPDKFKESYVYVICKNKDKFNRAKEVFDAYYDKNFRITSEFISHKQDREKEEWGTEMFTPKKLRKLNNV